METSTETIYMYSKGGEYYITPNHDLAVQRTDTGSIFIMNNNSNDDD